MASVGADTAEYLDLVMMMPCCHANCPTIELCQEFTLGASSELILAWWDFSVSLLQWTKNITRDLQAGTDSLVINRCITCVAEEVQDK
jgi:hypothetical protein